MTTLKTLALGLNRFLSRLFSDDPETIDYLNGADSLPPPLNKEEEKKSFFGKKRGYEGERNFIKGRWSIGTTNRTETLPDTVLHITQSMS